MLQNAQQMLRIVRGSYPDLTFEGVTGDDSCRSPQSEGESLSCEWSEVMARLRNHSVEDHDALSKLQEVCRTKKQSP